MEVNGERKKRGQIMQSFVLHDTSEIYTLSASPPSQPRVFPPLSFVIVCYYRHYENCYYSDCLDTRIAVGGDRTPGSVDVYSFNCSGKHEPFSAVPQHGPLERGGKWQREGVFDHFSLLVPTSFTVRSLGLTQSVIAFITRVAAGIVAFKRLKQTEIFSNDGAQCGNGNDCSKASALEPLSSSHTCSSNLQHFTHNFSRTVHPLETAHVNPFKTVLFLYRERSDGGFQTF